MRVDIPKKYPGKNFTSVETNDLVSRVNEPGKHESIFYPDKLTFDDSYLYSLPYQQTVNMNFGVFESAPVKKYVENGTTIPIISDGVHTFSFSDQYNWSLIGLTHGSTLPAGTYLFGFFYAGNNLIHVVAREIDEWRAGVADTSGPQFVSATFNDFGPEFVSADFNA